VPIPAPETRSHAELRASRWLREVAVMRGRGLLVAAALGSRPVAGAAGEGHDCLSSVCRAGSVLVVIDLWGR
jgi:hypothetical protein